MIYVMLSRLLAYVHLNGRKCDSTLIQTLPYTLTETTTDF